MQKLLGFIFLCSLVSIVNAGPSDYAQKMKSERRLRELGMQIKFQRSQGNMQRLLEDARRREQEFQRRQEEMQRR